MLLTGWGGWAGGLLGGSLLTAACGFWLHVGCSQLLLLLLRLLCCLPLPLPLPLLPLLLLLLLMIRIMRCLNRRPQLGSPCWTTGLLAGLGGAGRLLAGCCVLAACAAAAAAAACCLRLLLHVLRVLHVLLLLLLIYEVLNSATPTPRALPAAGQRRPGPAPPGRVQRPHRRRN